MNTREQRFGVRRRYKPMVVFPDNKTISAGYGGPGMGAGQTYAKLDEAIAHAEAMVTKGRSSFVRDYGTAGDPYNVPEIVWMGSPALRELHTELRDNPMRRINPINEYLPLPRPTLKYIRGVDRPDRGPEYRCMLCGQWYGDHRAGVMVEADWGAGVALVRQTAQRAGDEGGGYRSQGPVLWAMRVLKTQDFIMSHEATHGPLSKADRVEGWGRTLLVEEHVSRTPGHKIKNWHEWEPDWEVWFRDPEHGLLVWTGAAGTSGPYSAPQLYAPVSQSGPVYECSKDAVCKTATAKQIEQAALAEIPF